MRLHFKEFNMQEKLHRAVTLLLVFCMLVQMWTPVRAAADILVDTGATMLKDTNGNGYFEINNMDDWKAFCNPPNDPAMNLALKYELMTDLTIPEFSYYDADLTAATGKHVYARSNFRGEFEGNNHVVTIGQSGTVKGAFVYGLFGSASSASIHNVILEVDGAVDIALELDASKLTSNSQQMNINMGFLAGYGVLEKCSIQAKGGGAVPLNLSLTVTGAVPDSYPSSISMAIGGLVGNGSADNCMANVNLNLTVKEQLRKQAYENVFAGDYNLYSPTISQLYVGGLLGRGDTTNVYARGNVSVDYGLANAADWQKATNLYYPGVGGVVGRPERDDGVNKVSDVKVKTTMRDDAAWRAVVGHSTPTNNGVDINHSAKTIKMPKAAPVLTGAVTNTCMSTIGGYYVTQSAYDASGGVLGWGNYQDTGETGSINLPSRGTYTVHYQERSAITDTTAVVPGVNEALFNRLEASAPGVWMWYSGELGFQWMRPRTPEVKVEKRDGTHYATITRTDGSYAQAPIEYTANLHIMGQSASPDALAVTPDVQGQITAIIGMDGPSEATVGSDTQFKAIVNGKNLTTANLADINWIVSTGRDSLGKYPRILPTQIDGGGIDSAGKLHINEAEGLPDGLTLYVTAYVGNSPETAYAYYDFPVVMKKAAGSTSAVSASWRSWMMEQGMPLPPEDGASGSESSSSSSESSSSSSESSSSSSESSSSSGESSSSSSEPSSSSSALSSSGSDSESSSGTSSGSTSSVISMPESAGKLSVPGGGPEGYLALFNPPKTTARIYPRSFHKSVRVLADMVERIPLDPEAIWEKSGDSTQTYTLRISPTAGAAQPVGTKYYYAMRASENDIQPLTPYNSKVCAGSGFNEVSGVKEGDYIAVCAQNDTMDDVRESDTLLYHVEKDLDGSTVIAKRVSGVPHAYTAPAAAASIQKEATAGGTVSAWESWSNFNKTLTLNIGKLRREYNGGAQLSGITEAQLKDDVRFPLYSAAEAVKVSAVVKVPLSGGGGSLDSDYGDAADGGIQQATTPTIIPNAPGQTAIGNRVTLQAANDSDRVYFLVSYSATPSAGSWRDMINPATATPQPDVIVEKATYLYDKDKGIAFPENQSVMTVVAMAQRDGATESGATWVTYKDTSRPLNEKFMPRINGWGADSGFVPWNPNGYYDINQIQRSFYLYQTNLDSGIGKGYYTVNGSDPAVDSATGVPQGSTKEITKNIPLELPSVAADKTITVKALYRQENYPDVRESFVIRLKQPYSAPKMSIVGASSGNVTEGGTALTSIANRSKVTIAFNGEDIPLALRPVNGTVVLTGESIASYEDRMPKLYYSISVSDNQNTPPDNPTSASRLYMVERPQVLMLSNGGSIGAANAAEIDIQGNPKQYVWIKAVILNDDTIDPSKVAQSSYFNYRFQIQDQASAPVFTPDGAQSIGEAANYPIVLNKKIKLSQSGSETDVFIRYTLDGSPPDTSDAYNPNESKTKQIKGGEEITIPYSEYQSRVGQTLTLRAATIDNSTGGTRKSPSETTVRYYQLKQRPQASAPTIVKSGTKAEPTEIYGGDAVSVTVPTPDLASKLMVRSQHVTEGIEPVWADSDWVPYTANAVTLSNSTDQTEANKILVVQARVRGEDTDTFSDSDIVTSYFCRKRISPPNINPGASENNPVQIINYSYLTPVEVAADRDYEPQYKFSTGRNTMPNEPILNGKTHQVKMDAEDTYYYFNIQSTPTKNTDRVRESRVYRYVYTIKDLPAAEPPVASPSTSDTSPTELQRGAKIYLTSKTVNNVIYYTTDGSAPNTAEYKAADPDCPTKKYDPQKGIVMLPEEGEDLFFVMAVTQGKSDPNTPPKNSESPAMRVSYRLAQASTPTAGPSTTPGNIAQVAIGSKITLMSDTGVDIYYTTNGGMPKVDDTTGSTKKYDVPIAVTSAMGSPLYIRAIASPEAVDVTVDGTTRKVKPMKDSEVGYFTYEVRSLDAAPAPILSPSTSAISPASLKRGDKITATSGILGSKIYYTTDASLPDPNASDAWQAQLAQYLSANGADTDPGKIEALTQTFKRGNPEPATKLYNVQTGIPMDPEANANLFIVQAVVRDAASPQRYADSAVTQAVYCLAQAAPPTVNPSTSESSPTAITHNTILRLNAVTGAKIHYTTDGQTPSETVGGSTSVYDDAVGITEHQSFVGRKFIVRAIAVPETVGGKQALRTSEAATYPFQVESLPKAPAPQASPATTEAAPAKLDRYARIKLLGIPNGCTVRYTVDRTSPTVASASTKTYDDVKGILMNPPTGQEEFRITGIVTDTSAAPQYASSEIFYLTYRLAPSDTPQIWPETSADKITQINVGETITLTAQDDCKIYYSLSGRASASSTLYDPDKGIVPDKAYAGKNLTISAIAVPAEIENPDVSGEMGSARLPSSLLSATYKISNLPQAPTPMVLPSTSDITPTALMRGDKISLSVSGDFDIYYTTGRAGMPDTLYDGTPIEMNPEAGASMFYLRVQAKDRNVPQAYADSNVTTYLFQFSRMSAPTSYPATSSEAPTQLSIGDTVSLYPGDANIYYAVNRFPQKTSEYLYSPDTGIRIDQSLVSSAGGTVTINAFAAPKTADGADVSMLESATVSFLYRVSALPKAQAPVPSPATSDSSPATQRRGNKITLRCATLPSSIYYTTDGTTPNPEERLDWEKRFAAYVKGQLPDRTPTAVELAGYREIFISEKAENAEPSTLLYTSQGIAMNPADNTDTFVIQSVTVTRGSDGKATTHLDSDIARAVYRLIKADVPTSYPSTDKNNVAMVSIGSKITLSGPSGSDIYYTLDGSQPYSEDYEAWKNGSLTEEPATKKYDGVVTVPGGGGQYLYVNAVAVPRLEKGQKPMMDSDTARFTYQIKPLDPVATPVASPKTSDDSPTELKGYAQISLMTKTLNTRIYYTEDGTLPNPDARENWEKGPKDTPEPSTKLYNAQTGIAMAPAKSTSLFTVTAVAREMSGAYSDSELIRVTYRAAKASAPTATPATSEEKVATAVPGSKIILTAPESAVEIYYRTDDVLPDPSDTANIDRSTDASDTGKPIKLYQAQKGILMPNDVGTFFNIMAVVHDPKGVYADSDAVRFSYQTPAPVQGVYAAPGAGTVVKGTQVTLSCSTKDAKIFFEASTAGSAKEPVANSSQSYASPITINEDTSIKAIAELGGVVSEIASYDYKLADQLKAPTPSVKSGAVVPTGTPLKFSADSGATVVYTKDNSDPSQETNKSRLYGTELVIDGEEGKTVTIRALATQTGKTPSEVVTVTYTIAKAGDVIKANPASGTTLKKGDTVTLTTSVTGAQIYYTTDGTTPRTPSTSQKESGTKAQKETQTAQKGASAANITLDGEPGSTVTINAIATTGSDNAVPVVFTYPLIPKSPSPAASIPSGAITLSGAKVTLTVKDASIYYTTDGTDPTTSSTLYTDAIEADKTMVLKAMAKADNMEPSDIVAYSYTRAGDVAPPATTLPSGEINTGTLVQMTSMTQGAQIYYSTDGTVPTEENKDELFQYTGPISVTRPVTLKMFAMEEGLHSSPVNVTTYTVKEPARPEKQEEAQAASVAVTMTDRLMSRRAYSTRDQGPTFTDIILQDRPTGTVVCSPKEVLPQEARLTVEERQPAQSDDQAVRTALEGYGIAALFDVTLQSAGESIQPSGQMEIGLRIPSECANGLVMVCRVNDDSTVTTFPTRRSGDMAYAIVDHLSKYAVVTPQAQETEKTPGKIYWLWIVMGAALLAIVLNLAAFRRRKKHGA